jgi:carbon-monoxide dehydrogenase large subunit
MKVDVKGVVTNKTPNAPYRGAGRPETVFAMDRAVDCLARRLGLDPADIRRKNYIRADELPWDFGMPYRDGNPLVYDTGDFPAALESALQAAGYDAFRREQTAQRARGVWRGIGISGYVEGTAIGPFEGARVTLDAAGRVLVATGAVCSGQGHETAFAQVAADALGVPLDWVTVVGGDTAAVPFGIGTFASRSAVTAGNAVGVAARRLRDKVVAVAAELLETDPQDLDVEEGRVFARGVPQREVTFREIAAAATPGPRARLPAGMEPGLETQHYYVPPTVTFGSGTHVCAVEVDERTGHVQVLDYVTVDDCGQMLNPTIVEGQVHGGVAHGIGNGLYEEAVYDDSGQLLTTTYMDYLIPTAMEVPPIKVGHQEGFPSERNPLGVKGVGEGGAVSPPAAIANAVADALRPLDVRPTRVPLPPEMVLDLVRRARGQPPLA